MADEAPRRGRRERNKRDKLDRITQAARILFHRQGFDRTTTAQVAELAGIAEGTLFLYVSRKEDLLILAFASEMAEVVAKAHAGLDRKAGFLAQLLDFFDALLAYHLEDQDLARAFLREVGFLREPGRDYGFGKIPMMSSLGDIVEAAKERGEIDPAHDAQDVAILAFSAYWYCLREWANEMTAPAAFLERLRRLLALQIVGLRGAPSS